MTLEELNEQVNSIMLEMREIKKRHTAELKPYDDKIDMLNMSFIDSLLLDKNGDVIQRGMIIRDEKNKEFEVIGKTQQCLFQYLGNAIATVLPIGKKRPVKIHHREISNFTIVPGKSTIKKLKSEKP